MKIVYFYQYFSTPKGSWGTRVYEFTKNWVDKGHEVTVISSIYSKSDLKASSFTEDQNIDGINVKVVNITIDNKQSFVKRVYSFIAYSLISVYYALILKCDVVVASSGPITTGVPGIIAKVFKNRKFVFEVRDLWPEGAIELGIINNKRIKNIAYKFEELCYKKSDLIVALSPGMKSNIENRFPEMKVISVTNSANIELFSSPKEKLSFEELNNKKFAIYTGNIGLVNNSELLCKAALRLFEINRRDIKIVFIGDGQLKEGLKEKYNHVDNLFFLDLMPKNDLVNYVKNAMVSLVPLANTPMLATSSPNKLFESMAASVPVINTTNGWIKDMLDKTNSGFTVSPVDENELVRKLIFLADNEKVSTQMGENGYNYAVKAFDKDILSDKMLNNIEKIVYA